MKALLVRHIRSIEYRPWLANQELAVAVLPPSYWVGQPPLAWAMPDTLLCSSSASRFGGAAFPRAWRGRAKLDAPETHPRAGTANGLGAAPDVWMRHISSKAHSSEAA
jgi:hypothetical protein